jgi:ribonuclease BN (tRNA processing enzyme)
MALLKITFLGTGGAFTDFRQNYHNNAVIYTDEGFILIDCGGTAVQSMKELGLPVHDVSGVIVTHMHGDHIGGIEQLLWERYYTGATGPDFANTHLFTTGRLHEALRRALVDCVDEITVATGDAQHGGYETLVNRCVLPVDGQGMAWGRVKFNLKKTPHVVGRDVDKPAYGVVIRAEGHLRGGFYYTSDTIFRADIGDLFPHADVIFHDCTFSPKYPGTVHTHYEELLTLPEAVRNCIVLMHHTKVPEGVSPRQDGFLWAAGRHDSFVLEDNKLTISGPNGGAVYQQEAGQWKRAASIRVG